MPSVLVSANATCSVQYGVMVARDPTVYFRTQVFLGTAGQPFAFEQLPTRVVFDSGALENIKATAIWIRDQVNNDNPNTLPGWLRPIAE